MIIIDGSKKFVDELSTIDYLQNQNIPIIIIINELRINKKSITPYLKRFFVTIIYNIDFIIFLYLFISSSERELYLFIKSIKITG